MTRRLSAFVLAATVGCATSASYLYTPDDATRWTDGYPATFTRVPPEAPQGSVQLTSFGVVEIQPTGSAPLATLHIRMTVSNDGDAVPWKLSTSEQLVEIAGEGRSRPILVNTDDAALPAVEIGQRQRRVLDLYYGLPEGMADDELLPAFDVLWQVETPARTFGSRTHFVRVEKEPLEVTTRVVVTGWGPLWWYDPFYPRLVFHHHHPIVLRHFDHVRITRPPIWRYRPARRR